MFRGQRVGKKPTAAGTSDLEHESHLLTVTLVRSHVDRATQSLFFESLLLTHPSQPFSPDFFQVHSSTCSIIRDVYKKILGMVLPLSSSTCPQLDPDSLFHPSTFIHSSSLDSPIIETMNLNTKSPGGQSSHSMVPTSSNSADPSLNFDPIGLSPISTSAIQQDAFQALVAGELPADRTLIGDGQSLTPQLVELFLKVDARLKVRQPPLAVYLCLE